MEISCWENAPRRYSVIQGIRLGLLRMIQLQYSARVMLLPSVRAAS
jgi:hypothetical protein